MRTVEINSNYAQQIDSLMDANGLGKDYGARVQECDSLAEVFQALSDRAAQHVALLTETEPPIDNMFQFIMEQLSEKGSVALALFFEKESHSLGA